MDLEKELEQLRNSLLQAERIQTELDRLRRHVFDLRSQAVTEKLEDPSLIVRARRDIARMLTVARQRELSAEREQVAADVNE